MKYRVVQTIGEETVTKDYKTLKDVAKDLDIEIHLVRKNNKMTEGRIESKRPHHIYRDFFDNTKIHNIKKEVKKINNENN
jgi:hypothetical protein